MQRLIKWIDNNLLNVTLSAFIVLASLLPKIPIKFVEYTYIRIRLDDILPAVLVGVFVIQLLRKKIRLNTKFLPIFALFWLSVFISFALGYFFQKTIPVQNIGLLHSLRRLQYMSVFFVASSLVVSEQKFYQYMKVYFWTLLAVSFYGIGQRFLQFPSIQSMNPAYVDGRLLTLSPSDRINSTFGGHFDLAAYLTFSIPILLGFFISEANRRYFFLYTLALIGLLYTSARSSFIAYIVSISAFLLYFRRFKLYIFVMILTAGLLFTTGEMTKRFQQTFQVKTIYVDEQSGKITIDQRYDDSTKLPAGGFKLPLSKRKDLELDQERLRRIALEEAQREAARHGKKLTTMELEKRAAEMLKFIKPQQTILCDIACSTRLEAEWPRAIAAFLYRPIFGTGPSSITEATDNDFLRWLGELGLVGTGIFIYLLYSIHRLISRFGKTLDRNKRFIYSGFSFGLGALLINALYVDVFEASKVAYNFWIVAGCYVGVITANGRKTK